MSLKKKSILSENVLSLFRNIREWVKKSVKQISISFVIIAIFLAMCFYFNPFNYEFRVLTYNKHIINPERVDSIASISAKAKLIHELEKDKIILTPQEYTNNVVAYYNIIISFMAALLVLLSVITYFQLKFVTRKELPQVLLESVKDSREFEKALINAITGKLDDKYVSNEDVEEIVRSEVEMKIEETLSGKVSVSNEIKSVSGEKN